MFTGSCCGTGDCCSDVGGGGSGRGRAADGSVLAATVAIAATAVGRAVGCCCLSSFAALKEVSEAVQAAEESLMAASAALAAASAAASAKQPQVEAIAHRLA